MTKSRSPFVLHSAVTPEPIVVDNTINKLSLSWTIICCYHNRHFQRDLLASLSKSKCPLHLRLIIAPSPAPSRLIVIFCGGILLSPLLLGLAWLFPPSFCNFICQWRHGAGVGIMICASASCRGSGIGGAESGFVRMRHAVSLSVKVHQYTIFGKRRHKFTCCLGSEATGLWWMGVRWPGLLLKFLRISLWRTLSLICINLWLAFVWPLWTRTMVELGPKRRADYRSTELIQNRHDVTDRLVSCWLWWQDWQRGFVNQVMMPGGVPMIWQRYRELFIF